MKGSAAEREYIDAAPGTELEPCRGCGARWYRAPHGLSMEHPPGCSEVEKRRFPFAK